jgi:hypothetical protein
MLGQEGRDPGVSILCDSGMVSQLLSEEFHGRFFKLTPLVPAAGLEPAWPLPAKGF